LRGEPASTRASHILELPVLPREFLDGCLLFGRFDGAGAQAANAGHGVVGALVLRDQVTGEQGPRAAQTGAAMHADADKATRVNWSMTTSTQ